MIMKFGFTNIWTFFLIGYGIIWSYMIRINKKRGKQIEDPEQYGAGKKWRSFFTGFLPTIVLLIISVFLPTHLGACFIMGIFLYILGMTINIAAMDSFSENDAGLNTKGIYKYSRNPMYGGGILFFIGLYLMGWSTDFVSVIFLVIIIIWLLTTHFHVLLEEKFLLSKYGDSYKEYLKRVPRYIGFIKK